MKVLIIIKKWGALCILNVIYDGVYVYRCEVRSLNKKDTTYHKMFITVILNQRLQGKYGELYYIIDQIHQILFQTMKI